MRKLSDFLRLILQLGLIIIFGQYVKDIINLQFLLIAFILFSSFVYILKKLNFRSYIAILLILIFPWVIRILVILFSSLGKTFLQMVFDMNFFIILFPLYLSSLLTWFVLRKIKFRKYEVLINGLLLFILFWRQANYKISLFPNGSYLAFYTIFFLLLELLVLYLAISMERGINNKFLHSFKEFILFFALLIPLLVYLLLPLWKNYEEGSVAGGGGLLKSSMFRFDFSEYIKLETEISMSDDLVLMFRKEGKAKRLLLRRFVLSGYENGKGFFRMEKDRYNEDNELSPPDRLLPSYTEFPERLYKIREKVKQEYFLVNIDPSAFLSLNYPVNSQPIYNWDNSSFVRIYQSDAMISTMNIKEYDPHSMMDQEDFNHYTFIDKNDEVRQLSNELTENIPGSLLKTLQIENYLQKNYYYSLKPGVAPDGDQLSYFIFDSKKGYCSYFAFSMVLMCRSLGIPARVAVGFWVDPDVSVLNFYPVRADQAHAWVEVYFSEYGWLEFDPTSSDMFPGEQYPFAGFSLDEFSPLIEEILENDLVPENLYDGKLEEDQKKNEKKRFAQIYQFMVAWWYIIVCIFYTGFIFSYRFYPLVMLYCTKGKRKKAKYIYLYVRHLFSFERELYRDTVTDYAIKVKRKYDIDLIPLTELYLKSIFSPDFLQENLKQIKLEKGNILDDYKKRISFARRIATFIFPFIKGSLK